MASSINFQRFRRPVILPFSFLMGYNELSEQGKRTCSASHLSVTEVSDLAGKVVIEELIPELTWWEPKRVSKRAGAGWIWGILLMATADISLSYFGIYKIKYICINYKITSFSEKYS